MVVHEQDLSGLETDAKVESRIICCDVQCIQCT